MAHKNYCSTLLSQNNWSHSTCVLHPTNHMLIFKILNGSIFFAKPERPWLERSWPCFLAFLVLSNSDIKASYLHMLHMERYMTFWVNVQLLHDVLWTVWQVIAEEYFLSFGDFNTNSNRITLKISFIHYLVQYLYHLLLKHGQIRHSYFSIPFLSLEYWWFLQLSWIALRSVMTARFTPKNFSRSVIQESGSSYCYSSTAYCTKSCGMMRYAQN